VKIGDIIVIKPGGMVPLDGVVQAGNSYVDESAVTGEPLAKDKRKEDAIFAGTLNKTGILEIVVTKVASDSTIERIREMTFTATQHKAKTQKFIEKFSTYYTPSLLLLAVFWMFFSWFVLHIPFDRAFSAALVLLVISCPCALVISTPISIFSAIGNASSSGALIKGGKYLEIIGQIKAIALDKTRTLTYGEPIVTDVIPFGKSSREVLLSCAAGIEAFSEHPLAQSIVEAAKQEDLELHEIKNFESVFGKGAKAECLICDDQQHLIGKLQFILEEHKVPQEIVQQVEYYQNQGKTVIVVSTPKEVEGIIVVQDMIRSDSRALVTELQALGVQPVMLTGDHENVARAVAKKVGIQDVRANLLPQDKLKEIKDLSNHYGMTAMFGDGVNDAPALAFSSVGISMSALGNDTALEAASIILLNNHLKLIPFLIQLGRKTLRTIQFNTGFAIAIKFLFIGLALLGKTNLAIAIFADVGVTLLVIVNSLRLQQWKPSY
jgi:Cd2+/Zn2+-exporting ATPase